MTIEAAYAKNGRTDTLPLRADVAYLVERFWPGASHRLALARAGRAGRARRPAVFFAVPPATAPRHLRADLAAAGIAYRDERGEYADFHSLRHTFVTNLFDRGASPKEAQTLARHADARLTLARYAHCTDSAGGPRWSGCRPRFPPRLEGAFADPARQDCGRDPGRRDRPAQLISRRGGTDAPAPNDGEGDEESKDHDE